MTQAIRPFSTARGFCQGAYAMMTSPGRFQLPNDASLVLSFHHLIGFAVELYLKSFLLEKGLTEAELRHRHYGHNLKNLSLKAQEYNFWCPDSFSLVCYLRPHETYDYRYMKNEAQYQLYPIGLIFDQLSSLNNYVDDAIGASRSRGKEPDRSGWVLPDELSMWRIPQ